MKKYEEPEIQIVLIEQEDIITTSLLSENDYGEKFPWGDEYEI